MLLRLTLLTAALLAFPGAARAQAPSVSAPDVRPSCTNAVPQRHAGGGVTVAVKADCGVTITWAGGPLSLSVDGATVLTAADGPVVATTVSALGLRAGRSQRWTFGAGPSFDLTVDYGAVKRGSAAVKRARRGAGQRRRAADRARRR